MAKGDMVEKTVLTFVGLVVGGSLVSPFADIIAGAIGGNVTGAAATLVALLTLFFVILLIMLAVRSIRETR